MSAYRFGESFFFSMRASKVAPDPTCFGRDRRDSHGVRPGNYLPGLSLETTHIE